jgi:hypothetical protein
MKKIILLALAVVSGYFAEAQEYKGSKNKAVSAEQKLNEQYCTGLFQSTDGTILNLVANPINGGYLNILEWLDGRVAGLQVYNSRGVSVPVLRGGVPGIFIDEIQVPLNEVSSLNVHDIALIKIIKTPFYGGFNSSYGAIAIYTVDTGEEEEEESGK